MFDMVASIFSFIFDNFIVILGLIFLIAAVRTILYQPVADRLLHPGPSFALLGILTVHVIIFWLVSGDEDKILLLITQCFIPAVAAFITGSLFYKRKTVKAEYISIGIAYFVMFILALFFQNFLVSLIAGLLGVGVLFVVLSSIAGQARMDMESGDVHGDSEVVRKLHRQGFKPSGSHGDAQQQEQANQNLLQHGVNPDKKK